MKHVRQEVRNYYSDDVMEYTSMGAFFFLRFICPVSTYSLLSIYNLFLNIEINLSISLFQINHSNNLLLPLLLHWLICRHWLLLISTDYWKILPIQRAKELSFCYPKLFNGNRHPYPSYYYHFIIHSLNQMLRSKASNWFNLNNHSSLAMHMLMIPIVIVLYLLN